MPYRAKWARRSLAPTLAFTMRRTWAQAFLIQPFNDPTIPLALLAGVGMCFQVSGLSFRGPGAGDQVRV